ncbi:hypothetical protein PIB30_076247 [Stylosanthes scabra]|uniref:Uncharacterized protein n=1 Tax=Stylosanthes scabra TaxID=79078 RepID=A0ABU6RQZ4_9FABA|nr:hypothetical protein [Stylosanthes scabra]
MREAVLSTTTTKASPPERACHVFGAVAGEAEYLQARHRAELARLALNNNPFYSSDSSSDSDTQSSSSVSGTSTMAERLTLKQLGGASTTFDNQPNRFPELNANFELKSGDTDFTILNSASIPNRASNTTVSGYRSHED